MAGRAQLRGSAVGDGKDQHEHDARDDEHAGSARRCSHPSGGLIQPMKLFHRPATVLVIEAKKPVTHPTMTARLTPPIRPRAVMAHGRGRERS